MKFKALRQLERSDCGITCVRMIARHYGKKIPVKTLRKITETNKLGVSLKDISDAFKAIGMDSAALRISGQDILRMPCPAVVYWRQQHFVVLYEIDYKRKLFKIADPEKGKMKFSEEEFMSYWREGAEKGVVIVAEPGEGFDEKTFDTDSSLTGLARLVARELSKRKKTFLSVVLLSLLCMGGDMLVPILMQDTVDDGIADRNIRLVWMLIAGQFMIFLGNAVSSNVIQYLMAKAGLDLNLDMTRRYLKRLIAFPLSFFDCKIPADLIQKVDDQSRIKDFIMQIPSSVLFVTLNMIVFSGLMIWYNGWIFLFFLLMTLCEAGWSLIFMRRRKVLDYSYFSETALNRNNVYELINGMAEIKASGAHKSRLRQWESTQHRLIDLSLKSQLLNIGMSGGQSLIARIKEIAITGICATLVIKGNLTFGEMLTVGYIVGRLSGPFHNILGMAVNTQDAKISYERLDEVLNDDPDSQGDLPFTGPGVSNQLELSV